jgi:hypothetical protein
MVKDFISLLDFTPDEITGFLDLADDLKAKPKAGTPHPLLAGKSLALIFEKPSLRTRVTFQIGMFQLGGTAVLLETRLGERESVPDVARNLDRWVDGVAARTFSHAHVVELAALLPGPGDQHAHRPAAPLPDPRRRPGPARAPRQRPRQPQARLHRRWQQRLPLVGRACRAHAARPHARLPAAIPARHGTRRRVPRRGQGPHQVTHDVEGGVRGAT